MWKNSTLGIIFSTLWEYSKSHRILLFCAILFPTIGHTIDLINPYAIGQIINILQIDGRSGVPAALLWVYLLIFIKLSDTILNNIGAAFEKKMMRAASHTFMQDFYKKAQSLPLLWHQDHHSGDLVSRLNKANNALGTFAGAPGQLVWIGIGFFGPAFILLKIMPPVGIFALTVCVLTIAMTTLFDRKIKYYAALTNDIFHKVSAALNDYLGNIRTIIILHLGNQTANDVKKRLKETIPPFNAELKFKIGRWISTETLMEACVIASLIYILNVFAKEESTLQIGNIVMAVTYLRQMAMSVYNSSRYYGSLIQSTVDYQGFDLVNNAYADHISTHKQNDYTIDQWSNITVTGLSFVYATRQDNAALDNLNFTIKRGEKIALVGASGGGKSTLMAVLRGLYPVQQGTTTIDKNTYDSIDPIASISTLIPQDPEIFENTIRYNITLGVEHSDEEILDACRIACFDTVLADLPNGLDSKINEKGVNLSGGQKQRLALARGIFAIQDSSLVLFDEPTSSVDSMTERRMYTNLFSAFPDICLISSIHRLNLLNQFDTIWVMEKGRLVQQGSLEQLLTDANSSFKQLWTAYQQAEQDV